MKTILIHNIAGNNNQMFSPNERDGYNDPSIYLRERLFQLGYNLKTSDDNPIDNCIWGIFYDAISVKTYSGFHGLVRMLKTKLRGKSLVRNLYDEFIRERLEQRIALFLWEPPSVSPENWGPELHKLFPLIFTWHDDYVDGHKFIKIHWPQTRQFPEVPKIPFSQRKMLVNISMNKYSHHSRELYSARRDAIRCFEHKYPDNFDLFGFMWDKSPTLLERCLPWIRQSYPSYRGIAKNKWDVMPYYRFSICYENMRDEPGYVTEKIFDSMRCGCVPIYWGAPNIHDYVDADAFIDRRQFKTNEELDSYLSNMTQQEYERFQKAIRSYLAGPRFARFLPTAYADTIINALKLNI